LPAGERLNRTVEIACLIAALAAIPACTGPEIHEPAGPEPCALALFDLSREGEPDPAEVERLFGPEPDGARRAALLDALGALAEADAVRVVGTQELALLNRVAVDLVADLAGEGPATYSVQLEPREPNGWRVTWFGGPDVEWPPSRRRRGSSLTTRSP
jgi:hypothetical protein